MFLILLRLFYCRKTDFSDFGEGKNYQLEGYILKTEFPLFSINDENNSLYTSLLSYNADIFDENSYEIGIGFGGIMYLNDIHNKNNLKFLRKLHQLIIPLEEAFVDSNSLISKKFQKLIAKFNIDYEKINQNIKDIENVTLEELKTIFNYFNKLEVNLLTLVRRNSELKTFIDEERSGYIQFIFLDQNFDTVLETELISVESFTDFEVDH